jgi:hypothetical protein
MRTTRTKKMLVVISTALFTMTGASGLVIAGLKSTQNVTVSATSASGAVGTARASADAVQFIRCTVQGTTAGNNVFCAARNTAGTSLSCTANGSPNLAHSVAAIGPTSRIYFAVNASGACIQVDVTNSSEYPPMVP